MQGLYSPRQHRCLTTPTHKVYRECINNGMEYWNTGMVEWWNTGMVEWPTTKDQLLFLKKNSFVLLNFVSTFEYTNLTVNTLASSSMSRIQHSIKRATLLTHA